MAQLNINLKKWLLRNEEVDEAHVIDLDQEGTDDADILASCRMACWQYRAKSQEFRVKLQVSIRWKKKIRRTVILSRASEVGSPTNHPGLRAATRHGARDPLVRPQVDQTYWGASIITYTTFFKRNEPHI